MWSQIASVCSLFVLGGAVAMGAGIDGKWVADPNDTIKSLVFVFKVNDGVLTGTATPETLPPGEISKGKVEGNQISFEVTRTVLMTKVTTKYSGTIGDDIIKLHASTVRGSMDFVLRKK